MLGDVVIVAGLVEQRSNFIYDFVTVTSTKQELILIHHQNILEAVIHLDFEILHLFGDVWVMHKQEAEWVYEQIEWNME